MRPLPKICFTVCMVCIFGSVVLSFGLIWTGADNEVLWRGLLSVLVLFIASGAAILIERAVHK